MIYIINEEPQACKRARHGQGRTYDPQKALKERWRWFLKPQHKGPILSGKPLELDVTFYMPIPKSLSQKKRDALVGTPHFKKPDFDNLAKLISDVCVGIIIQDDGLISDSIQRKRYSYNPRIEFTLKELEIKPEKIVCCRSHNKCDACLKEFYANTRKEPSNIR